MKYVVVGNYGAQNLGDEMILEGMIEMLKKADSSAEICVLKGNEKFPAGIKSGIKWIFGGNKNTKEKVKDCDYFVLGGGGLFGSISQYANVIWGLQASYAYRNKKPVLMLGQSVGKIKNRYIKKLVKNLFNKADLISVRDLKSKENLKEIGVTKKIVVVPDLAFKRPEGLPTKKCERAEGANSMDDNPQNSNSYDEKQMHLHGIDDSSVPSKDIIIALRQMKGLPQSFKIQIARFVEWLKQEEKLNVKFVNFQTGKVDNDEKLHEEIKGMIGDSTIEIISPKSTEEAMNLFENASFSLCMRLHSIITAMLTNTPFVAINYAEKVENLMDYMGSKENLLEMENVSFETLKNLYNKTTKEFARSTRSYLKVGNPSGRLEEFISLYLRKLQKK
ncbi:MAG: polysaccharide pyruvyl transferase family protein [Candidatus Peregrinibacteria bacterium]|nr:polysaccharide pyruvyl transferase family protein [Candidatus Peregrinibacteria bacterium]